MAKRDRCFPFNVPKLAAINTDTDVADLVSANLSFECFVLALG